MNNQILFFVASLNIKYLNKKYLFKNKSSGQFIGRIKQLEDKVSTEFFRPDTVYMYGCHTF